MQADNHSTSHSRANNKIRPSGSVASRYDSNSSGPRSSSLSGESSKPENLNEAPSKLISSCPNRVTIPDCSSALKTRVPEEPENIVIVSPCDSMSPTGPNVRGDCFSRHSFSLRNANRHETLFIGWAHLSGIIRAKSLAARFHWKFQRPLPELLVVIDELDRNCNARNAKRKPLLGSSVSLKKRSSNG